MLTVRHLLAATLAAGALSLVPGAAKAAQSYDSCTGFIESLPATITTQGTWCLRKNLSTSITSGNAITIAANNVTLDCNDFKVGGLGGGSESKTNGIYADDQANVTVRQCTVRGFYRGVFLNKGFGHLIEGNRVDNNLYIGIASGGSNAAETGSVIRNNQVLDTGGGSISARGIAATDYLIENNLVHGVFAAGTSPHTIGISLSKRGIVRGNQVRIANSLASGNAIGIDAAAAYSVVERNIVEGNGNVYPSTAITGDNCRDNTAMWVKTGEVCSLSVGYQGW